MDFDNKRFFELYQGLRALEEKYFPLKCPMCGRVYANFEEFLSRTEKLSRSSGLIEYRDKRPIVGLFRNCACKTTITVYCHDRRDMSENGIKRRETCEKLIDMLKATGLEHRVAREEVLKLMRGEESEVVKRLGIVQHRDTPPGDAGANGGEGKASP